VPRRLPRRALLAVLLLAGALALGAAALWLTTPSVDHLARDNPRTTALIEQRRAEARARRLPYQPVRVWVGLERISPRLVEAVLLSEDAGFHGHGGFAWEEIRAAAADAWRRGRPGRGASTLTQQLAKNLFLGTERSLWRKFREAVLAVKLERALPKRRILALYLNVAEWGPGLFGVEAGARHWLGAGAGEVTTAQAVILASMLPAPRQVGLAPPPRWLQRRARRLLDRMQSAARIGAEEHAHAAAELDRILAGASGDEEPPEEDVPPPEAAVD